MAPHPAQCTSIIGLCHTSSAALLPEGSSNKRIYDINKKNLLDLREITFRSQTPYSPGACKSGGHWNRRYILFS